MECRTRAPPLAASWRSAAWRAVLAEMDNLLWSVQPKLKVKDRRDLVTQLPEMLSRLRVARLLAGFRGRPPARLGAVTAAITGVSAIAAELGGELAALDINPLICGPAGAVAVDVLVQPAAG